MIRIRTIVVGASLLGAATAHPPRDIGGAGSRVLMSPRLMNGRDRVIASDDPRSFPPAPWNAKDPADSLYRAARGALSDNDYARAAALFGEVVDRYPRSDYAADALYWRAWALYRNATKDAGGGVSGDRDFDAALSALDRQDKSYPRAATRRDARDLRARIQATLAKRGDPNAAVALQKMADPLDSARGCPGEDDDMRLIALQGMMQMDAEAALPILKQVLARRGNCTESLRRRATFLVAQKPGDEATNLLLGVARADPSSDVRAEAIQWLGQSHSERAVVALDSILFSAADADIREKAIFSLSQQGDARATQSLRRFAENDKMPADLRAKAIFWLGQSHSGEDNAQYLRALFSRTNEDQLREAVIQAIAQSRTGDSEKWLLDIARDRSVGVDARKNALFWAGQSHGSDVQPLIALYDDLRGQEDLQDHMLFVLSQRRESVATDKLMQIASKDPNRDLRKKAIFWLGQKKDPRVTQFLLDLINR